MENVNENKIPDDSKFLLSFLQELHKEKNDVPEMIKKKKVSTENVPKQKKINQIKSKSETTTSIEMLPGRRK